LKAAQTNGILTYSRRAAERESQHPHLTTHQPPNTTEVRRRNRSETLQAAILVATAVILVVIHPVTRHPITTIRRKRRKV